MPVTLTRLFFAAAIAGAALPASAAGMPDSGTKNFDPGGATPSYFTNENGAALGLTESEGADEGADTPDHLVPIVPEHRRSTFVGYQSPTRSVTHSRASGHVSRVAEARSARAASAGRSVRLRRSELASEARNSFRTGHGGGPRQGGSGVRHAAARFSSRKG
jgi:hypothetical protein